MPSSPTPPPPCPFPPPSQLGVLSGIEPDSDIAATELGGLRLDDYARVLARLNGAEVEPRDAKGLRVVLASVGLDETRWRQGAALWRAELTTDIEREAPRYAETFAILYRREEAFGGDITGVEETAPVAHIALSAAELRYQDGDDDPPDVEDTMVSPVYSPAVEAMSVKRYAEQTHGEREAVTETERRRVFDMFGLQDEVHRARLEREMKRLFAEKSELQRRFDQALERLSSDR